MAEAPAQARSRPEEALQPGRTSRSRDPLYDDADSLLCRAHGCARIRTRVPVIYGYVVTVYLIPDEVSRLERVVFPNEWSYVLGGCIVGSGPEKTTVRYCAVCRATVSAWVIRQRSHPHASVGGTTGASASR